MHDVWGARRVNANVKKSTQIGDVVHSFHGTGQSPHSTRCDEWRDVWNKRRCIKSLLFKVEDCAVAIGNLFFETWEKEEADSVHRTGQESWVISPDRLVLTWRKGTKHNWFCTNFTTQHGCNDPPHWEFHGSHQCLFQFCILSANLLFQSLCLPTISVFSCLSVSSHVSHFFMGSSTHLPLPLCFPLSFPVFCLCPTGIFRDYMNVS